MVHVAVVSLAWYKPLAFRSWYLRGAFFCVLQAVLRPLGWKGVRQA